MVKNAEMRTTQNNKMVASFTIAVDRRFKQEGGQTADFINIIAWSKTAEFIDKYFSKGMKIGIVGRIQTRSWDDAEGKKRYATEVVAEEVEFVESKKAQESNNQARVESVDDGYFPIDDSDIPF